MNETFVKEELPSRASPVYFPTDSIESVISNGVARDRQYVRTSPNNNSSLYRVLEEGQHVRVLREVSDISSKMTWYEIEIVDEIIVEVDGVQSKKEIVSTGYISMDYIPIIDKETIEEVNTRIFTTLEEEHLSFEKELAESTDDIPVLASQPDPKKVVKPVKEIASHEKSKVQSVRIDSTVSIEVDTKREENKEAREPDKVNPPPKSVVKAPSEPNTIPVKKDKAKKPAPDSKEPVHNTSKPVKGDVKDEKGDSSEVTESVVKDPDKNPPSSEMDNLNAVEKEQNASDLPEKENPIVSVDVPVQKPKEDLSQTETDTVDGQLPRSNDEE